MVEKDFGQFESSVNPEGIQTPIFLKCGCLRFESSVNPEGIQTNGRVKQAEKLFESSVNPEGIQTVSIFFFSSMRLRAV